MRRSGFLADRAALRRLLLAGVCVAALGDGRAAAQSATAPSVLGKDAAVYTVRSEEVAGNPALVLEIARPGRAAERVTVPGTESPWPESFPSLVYQERSDAFFLLWQGYIGPINPALQLATYRNGAWTNLTQLVAGPWSPKSAPQLLATHEVHTDRADGGKTVREITVLHVVWAEDTVGAFETFYAPIVLVDGEYIGSHEIYRLSDFDPSAPADVEFDLAQALQQSPRLRAGRDERSVSVLFANALTKRVLSMEIDVLPAALVSIADGARGHIIVWGVKNDLMKKAALAASVSTWIRANGNELLPEVVDGIADAVSAKVLADPGAGPDDLVRIADEARGHIIIWGSRSRDRGLARAVSAISVTFADMAARDDDGAPDATRTAASFRFSVATSRLGFRISGGDARMFLSPDASRAAIAWFDQGAPGVVRYRLSEGSGWSETQELPLTKTLSLERALEILDQRISKR